MAKTNIYDLTISEIILRLAAITTATASTARLEITSTVGEEVYENFNGNHTFTSQVVNMPTGYAVKSNTHVITTPTAPTTTTGSASPLTTALHSVILGAVGSTYNVTSTVVLEKAASPDITLNATYTVTSVLPAYYGVKTYALTPTLTGLNLMAGSSSQFNLTNSSIGRLIIALPTANADILTVEDNHGNVWPVSDFTKTVSGSHEVWQLNYDTMFTGTNIKVFTIKTQ